MPGSLEIQITREICTTIESSAMAAQHSSMEGVRSTIEARPTPALPSPAHFRRSSMPVLPSAPPAYEATGPPAIHSSLDVNVFNSSDDVPPPPDYTKFIEVTRAERCFYYGFLFFPIWFFGFLHFWPTFSRTPTTLPAKDEELLPTWIDPLTGIAMYSGPPSSSSSTSSPNSPSQKTFSWRRKTPSSSSQSQARPPSRQSCRILMMNRPDAYGAWRKEERAWALRCGYAMAATWAITVMLVFVCVQTGVFGFYWK
ncbi:hypothetical protein P389DRAFT_195091 [Cystobasidium minutum MCA 4210]|uniref:uncharacterized protein n=1 Tax=Cystobasidium minutum MCA 4210 TaxID=1397322 RepID=UPI0034CFE35B|eukprot:jgi/Rhomi1/195091/gm1.3305_g